VLVSGTERLTADDLRTLSDLVAAAWMSAVDADWSRPAGTLAWSCLETADHAVDCVYAPAFFLASRRLDAYPEIGEHLTLGATATPALLVESLAIAARMLVGTVAEAEPDVRAIIFQRPEVIVAPPADFLPRGAMELILHAHDVCSGLGVPFEPPADLCHRLREHTRPWPMWTTFWQGLAATDDPWGDLLTGSGRERRRG
jgi:hypothetical protein